MDNGGPVMTSSPGDYAGTEPIALAFHWSGGKDSALALGRLLDDERYDVRCLITTMDAEHQESSVHRLPRHLLQAQAEAIGVPLYPVMLSSAGLDDYVEAMNKAGRVLYTRGIRACAVGDLAQSGAVAIKREQFQPLGIEVIAPLNELTSAQCLDEFLASGIEALTIVVNAAQLNEHHLGAAVTPGFIAALPADCDAMGEGGEYHTFVSDAPYFRHSVDYTVSGTERIHQSINTTDGPQEFTYLQLRLR